MVKVKKSWYVKRREQRLALISKRRTRFVKGKLIPGWSKRGKIKVRYNYANGKRRHYWIRKESLLKNRNIRVIYSGAYNHGRTHESIGATTAWAPLSGKKEKRKSQLEQLVKDAKVQAFTKIYIIIHGTGKAYDSDDVWDQYRQSFSKGYIRTKKIRYEVRKW